MTNILSPGILARLVVTAILLVTLASCRPAQSFKTEGKLKVLATTGMVADLVRQIGGDKVEVVALMGPGVDPHLYKPTAGDIGRIAEADLVVFNGLHLEGRMAEALRQLGPQAIPIAETTSSENLLKAEENEDDPHIWLDPSLWSTLVDPLAETLAKADPQNAETYRSRANSYRALLLRLDQEAADALATIPKKSRVLVTAHDAFQYFGHRYEIEVLGIQGTNTAAEASPARIRELADLITGRKIKAIFVESSVSPALVRALQEAVRDRGWDVQLGGELLADSPGAAGTPESTVEGMVRHNVRTIVEALS